MLRTEVAVALSENVSCCFWDMEKFFDSVHHDVLLGEAVALGFPMLELSLAMQQHAGTRYLTYRMSISEAVAPTRSLLPGCFWAIPLVRVLLRREMASLAVHCPVSLTAYVDDVAQHAVGPDVLNHAVQAARDFILAARRLRLKIAPKSCVFSNNRTVHAALHRVLFLEGLLTQDQLRCAISLRRTATRDLGIHHVIHGSRRVPLLRSRLSAATARLHRTRRIASTHYRARRLVPTNAYPKAFWGVEATGVAPSVITRFRTAAAAGTGCIIPGRCATTALAVARITDPEEEVVSRILKAWLKFLLRSVAPARLRCAWRLVHRRIIQAGSPVWNKVNGPLAALIATLTWFGWDVRCMDAWHSPDDVVVRPFAAHADEVSRIVIPGVRSFLWTRAAQHYLGGGLQQGVHDVSFHASAALRRYDPGAAGTLECIMVGGLWHPDRVAAHFDTSPACPRCGAAHADPFHNFWQCPDNARVDDNAVALSDFLSPLADPLVPGLWCRGLLPVGLGTPLTAPPIAMHLRKFGQCPASWPSGLYCTDGSGGRFGSYPSLRRCGVGVAHVVAGRVVFGACSPLWGPQSVPRAELAAVLVVALFAAPGASIALAIDSRITCDGVNGGGRHANSDMWALIDAQVCKKGLVLSARWVKSHLDAAPAKVRGYSFPVAHIIGNSAADHFAEVAALGCQVPDGDALEILQWYDRVAMIQSRMIAIQTHIMVHAAPRPARSHPTRPSRPVSLLTLAAQSAHVVSWGSTSPSCRFCFGRPTGPVRDWLQGPCLGPPAALLPGLVGSLSRPIKVSGVDIAVGGSVLHCSHDLWIMRGFVFCRQCCHLTSGSRRNPKLTAPCGTALVASGGGVGRVKRLSLGHHPYSNSGAWPGGASPTHWSDRWTAAPACPIASHLGDAAPPAR